MMCDHDGGHALPPAIVTKVPEFFADHPYKVAPEPYAAGLPSGFPSYCRDQL